MTEISYYTEEGLSNLKEEIKRVKKKKENCIKNGVNDLKLYKIFKGGGEWFEYIPLLYYVLD